MSPYTQPAARKKNGFRPLAELLNSLLILLLQKWIFQSRQGYCPWWPDLGLINAAVSKCLPPTKTTTSSSTTTTIRKSKGKPKENKRKLWKSKENHWAVKKTNRNTTAFRWVIKTSPSPAQPSINFRWGIKYQPSPALTFFWVLNIAFRASGVCSANIGRGITGIGGGGGP